MVPERTVVLMKCPACAHPESRVIDSRPSSDGSSIRRRRECLHCQKRFTTYETIETVPITVVKKDKSRESFDRNKVLNSIIRAWRQAACDPRRDGFGGVLHRDAASEFAADRDSLLPHRRDGDGAGSRTSTRWPTSVSHRSTGSSRTSTRFWTS